MNPTFARGGKYKGTEAQRHKVGIVAKALGCLKTVRFYVFGKGPENIVRIMMLAAAICVGASPAMSQEAGVEGTIVAMGDSLTEGLGVSETDAYPARLEQQLRTAGYAFRVINAGVSGETSSGALSRTRWMLALKPDIVILETGANDGLRGIDPVVTRRNISQILSILKEKNITVVLAGMRMVVNMGKAYVDAFEAVYPSLAERFDVVYMPFFLEGVAGDPLLNREDGLHPNSSGYRIIAENIFPHTTAAIDKWRTEFSGKSF